MIQLPFVSRETYQEAQLEIAQLKAKLVDVTADYERRLVETADARDRALDMSISLAKALETSGKAEPAPPPESTIPARPQIRHVKALAAADAMKRHNEAKANRPS